MAGVPHVLLAGVLGIVASTLTAIWLKADKAALMAGLYGHNGVACGAGARNLPCLGRRALDLYRAGRCGLDRRDAWGRKPAQAVRGLCADSAVCCGHLGRTFPSIGTAPVSPEFGWR